jgi:Golgi phosphoprotein 3 (GPP34)
VSDGDGIRPTWAPLELPLADDLFLAAHDETKGKLRLTERGAGIGLAAALLGELVLYRKITLQRDRVVAVDRRPVPDALAHLLLEDVVSEPEQRPVRDWLRYLDRRSYELVGQRMVRENLVRVRETGRFRRSPWYRACDPNAAAWPVVRLAQKLARREAVALPDVLLAGLIRATGLEHYLRTEAVVDINDYLRYLITGLPPPLRGLVAETEAAIGEAVLHHRW